MPRHMTYSMQSFEFYFLHLLSNCVAAIAS
jgi:hypothetical protein